MEKEILRRVVDTTGERSTVTRQMRKHNVERHNYGTRADYYNATSGDRANVAQRRAAGVAGVPRGGGDSPGPTRPPPVYRWQHRGHHRRRRRRGTYTCVPSP